VANRTAIAWAVALASLSACTGGVVSDPATGRGINDVRVLARRCESEHTRCLPMVRTTSNQAINGSTTRADGVFQYDPYEGGQYTYPLEGKGASEFTFTKPGFQTVVKYHRPDYQMIEHASGEQRAYSTMSVYLPRERDSDGDGLADDVERKLGTLVDDVDTDQDGLPDGWEVNGHDWVDYAAFGANPRVRDLFVEIDYQEFTVGGVKHSAKLSSAVVAKIEQLYRNLNVVNHDGSRGVAIHLFHDDTLPQDHDCSVRYLEDTFFSEDHRDVFHYGQLCLTSDRNEQRGEATGLHFFGRALEINADPTDDQTEFQQFAWALIVPHEIGHTYGLGHGGGDTLNCKPNYPSIMNYAHMKHYLGSAQTVRDTLVQFSPGRFASTPLSEDRLPERNPFGPDVLRSEMLFLTNFGSPERMFRFNLHSTQPWVDWDGDRIFVTGGVAMDLNARGYVPLSGGIDRCAFDNSGRSHEVLRDYNDGQLVADFLRRAGPAARLRGEAVSPVVAPTVCPAL